jgi:tetratricopeptide (TPR) repeat protein
MSNYICINSNCIISQSKASFPSEGNCPLCQQALKELSIAPVLNHQDEQLIASLPYVIAYPLQDTFQQSDYEKKLHRLAYTFNNFLKYLGLISISEFIHSDFKSRKMIDLFESNIGEPSFGRWNQFIRESYALLSKEKIKLVFPEVYKFYQKANEKKFKIEVEMIDDFGDVNYSEKNGMTAIDMLINFRNKYLGHGTPLSDKQAKALWEYYYPIFKDLLQLMTAQLALHMYKKENNSCWKLQSTEITETADAPEIDEARVWLADDKGRKLPLIPFFIIPTLLGDFENESKLMVYEAYNGQSIKFFSPENIVKETSGEILQRLKLLLREKQKEVPFTPESFGKTQLLERLTEENTWVMETLLREKKIIEGVYQQRQSMEIKLREWIGARANIFFIAAEAGSGKTNLLAEMMNQYKERNISCLFLRAARMQKNTLREELAYRLNIDENHSLEDYTIAGTQAEPTIILLDGLNEAKNSESLWDEILQLSKQFEPGALKFIIGNRANAKDDLNRYPIAETDEQLLYGEKKENEKGLCAYVHWLTPMDMQEMKGAWEHYYQMKKGIYRPNFDFDRIAQFDRGIYNQISNPLVMRLFLELYHGKSLPKKGRHLNIWKDWFRIFSAEEQSFMQNLAALIWEKGANELLFDTVQKSERMKSFFNDEKSKIPYQRLLKNGWISRYSKDLDAYIAFTVEGLLLYILGLQLYTKSPKIDLAAVEDLIQSGKKLKKAALDSFLAELAQRDEMELITALIDSGGDKIGICIAPLFIYMKNRGVKALLDKVLENKTENDWEALLNLEGLLNELELEKLLREFYEKILDELAFDSMYSVLLGLNALGNLNIDKANEYKYKIDNIPEDLKKDYEILKRLGSYECRFANYKKAIEYYEKAYKVKKDEDEAGSFRLLSIYNSLGFVYNEMSDLSMAEHFWKKALDYSIEYYGEESSSFEFLNMGVLTHKLKRYEEALDYYKKSLEIDLKKFGENSLGVAFSFMNIGLIYMEYDIDFSKSLEYLNKSLKIRRTILGDFHEDVAYILYNLGVINEKVKKLDEAQNFYSHTYDIRLRIFGKFHPELAKSLNSIGNILYKKNEYLKALDFHENALEIFETTLGKNNTNVADTYRKIANIWFMCEDYDKASEFYYKCLGILEANVNVIKDSELKELYYWIAKSEYEKKEYNKATINFEKSLEIGLKNKMEDKQLVYLYNWLGYIYFLDKDYQKAILNYELRLSILEKNENKNYLKIYETQQSIGESYYKLGDFYKAVEQYEKVKEISSKCNLEDKDFDYLYNWLGYLYFKIEDFQKAITSYELRLRILEKNDKTNYLEIYKTQKVIGDSYYEIDDFDNAIKKYEKCIDLTLRYDIDEKELEGLYNSSACIYSVQKEYLKAITKYELSLSILQKDISTNYLEIFETKRSLGDSFYNLGELDKAIEQYKEAKNISSKYLVDGKELEDLYNWLGKVYFLKKEYHSAIESYKSGFEIYKNARFLYGIAQCYEALGDIKFAIDYFIQCAEILKTDRGVENTNAKKAIQNAKRLATELGKENELPDWMREL